MRHNYNQGIIPVREPGVKGYLLDIKRRHGLSTNAIAAIAGVEPSLVYWMEQRGILSQKDLEKILGGISRVTGQNYSMETVGGYWVSIEKHV